MGKKQEIDIRIKDGKIAEIGENLSIKVKKNLMQKVYQFHLDLLIYIFICVNQAEKRKKQLKQEHLQLQKAALRLLRQCQIQVLFQISRTNGLVCRTD